MSSRAEKVPLFAAAGLACVVALVGILPVLRDPASLDALEGVTGASSSRAARDGGDTSAGTGTHGTGAKKDEPEPPSTASQAELDQATTVEQLAKLAERFGDDPKVLAKLARAQGADANGLIAACATLRKLFGIDPESMKNSDLLAVLKRAANGPAQASDLAFDIMATSMGSAGVDLMFEIATTPSTSKVVRDRAISLTKREEIRKKASPALLVALDLRDSSGCERKQHFARAKELADARALQYLTPLTATKGCGVFGLGDCFDGCLGNRKDLNETIKAIKAKGS
ncbi:MAG TPA: hypothetical protein VL400_03315 [Polyangiaceae bacterium]|nr:hypothetical protein [Polyangiaceae bacterium]